MWASISVASAAHPPGCRSRSRSPASSGRDVTHGCRIAATGELALDGSVLPIGGIKQKTIGARRADVDFFLVPAGENAEGALDNADGLRIIPVDSFQQALRRLTTKEIKC